VSLDADIAEFISLCRVSTFRDRDEILDGLESRKYKLARSVGESVPAKSMLEVYRRRARHVSQFTDKSSHARRMVGNIVAYVCELENAPDDEIKLWRVTENGVRSYSIFQGVVSGKILGCVFGIDRRKVSEDEWKALWGETEK
jgi:hypothetical protein